MADGYRTLHLDDIPTVRFRGDDTQPDWKPVRRHLGVTAFGTNAYVARAGEIVIEEHDELDPAGGSGHQELYLVLSGVARFTIGGEEQTVPAGGIVFIEDPALRRRAEALEDETVVFAVGAPAGEAFAPSAWEDRFLAEGEQDAAS